MSRFRLITLVCVVLTGAIALCFSWSRQPELPPEPARIDVRGPATMAQNADHDRWEMAKSASLANTGSAVTIESETIALLVGILTFMTLLLTLLSKYLIAPLITRQLADFMGKVDEKFVSRQTIEAHLVLDDARYEAIESQLDKIWERVK